MGFEFKEDLKDLLPEYLEILAREGKTEYRGNDFWDCPFCGSGTNRNHTAGFHILNGVRYKCFACGEHGDIYDLVAYEEGLPSDQWKRHYNKALQILKNYLPGKQITKASVPEDTIKKAEADYAKYLQQCHRNIGQTEYFKERGLSDQLIERFMLGYDPGRHLVTIPYNSDCKGYVHRILFAGDNKYCKRGNEIFNLAALQSGEPVFVVEGQIDAMSIEEIGYSAIGIGGINEIENLVKILKNMNSTEKKLILALDNDLPGRKATAALIGLLADAKTNCDYVVVSGIYGEYKDANEYLCRDRQGFENICEKVRRIYL